MDGRKCLEDSDKSFSQLTVYRWHMLQQCGLNPLAQSHEALLDDVSLSLGEGPSSRQPVDGVQHGVDHDRPVVAASKEGGALGDEWQHCRAQVAVEGQGHLGSAEGNLVEQRPDL